MIVSITDDVLFQVFVSLIQWWLVFHPEGDRELIGQIVIECSLGYDHSIGCAVELINLIAFSAVICGQISGPFSACRRRWQ